MSRHILAENNPNSFAPAAKQTPKKNRRTFFPPTAIKGAAKKTRRAASRTTPTARGDENTSCHGPFFRARPGLYFRKCDEPGRAGPETFEKSMDWAGPGHELLEM